jgi:trk system potassium uptake protein TrkA
VNVVILGAGSVGFKLAKQLIEEDKEVRLIERDPEKAKQGSNLLDCMVVNEQASTQQVPTPARS